jgi:hypothetical protein
MHQAVHPVIEKSNYEYEQEILCDDARHRAKQIQPKVLPHKMAVVKRRAQCREVADDCQHICYVHKIRNNIAAEGRRGTQEFIQRATIPADSDQFDYKHYRQSGESAGGAQQYQSNPILHE